MAARSPLNKDSNVIIDYLTPGACKSDIFRDDVSCKRKWSTHAGLCLTTMAHRDPTILHGTHDLDDRPHHRSGKSHTRSLCQARNRTERAWCIPHGLQGLPVSELKPHSRSTRANNHTATATTSTATKAARCRRNSPMSCSRNWSRSSLELLHVSDM